MSGRDSYFIVKNTRNSTALDVDTLDVETFQPNAIILPSGTFLNEMKVFSPLDLVNYHTRFYWNPNAVEMGDYKGTVQSGKFVAYSGFETAYCQVVPVEDFGLSFRSTDYGMPPITEVFRYNVNGVKIGENGTLMKQMRRGKTNTITASANTGNVDITLSPVVSNTNYEVWCQVVDAGSGDRYCTSIGTKAVDKFRVHWRNVVDGQTAGSFYIAWMLIQN